MNGDGIGRFSREILSRLPRFEPLRSSLRPLNPVDGVVTSWLARRANAACLFSPGFNPPVGSLRPFVFTIHDLIHLDFPAETSFAKSLYYRLIVKPAARRAFRVLTVSEYSKAKIVAWAGLPGDRVVVVPNGVNTLFQPTGDAFQPGYDYILYVGNQKPHKNIGRLLHAMTHVALGANARLIMTGQPTSATSSLIAQLNLQHRVEFVGALSDERLAQVYRGARQLVLPSLMEGFGLPVVEAMACGTPVVCANTAALPEIAGGAARLVDPTNVTDIAKGMLDVLQNESVRTALRRKGLERARSFNWDKSAAKVWQVLQQAARTDISN